MQESRLRGRVNSFFSARQPSAGRLMLCLCYFLSSSFIIIFFNDRLEQRDLGNYKTELHQIFSGGRHVGICSIWYWFRGWSRDVAMATYFRREIGRNRRHAFLLGDCISQRWQNGTADERVNSPEVLTTSYKNLVNFGSLILEFTVMFW